MYRTYNAEQIGTIQKRNAQPHLAVRQRLVDVRQPVAQLDGCLTVRDRLCQEVSSLLSGLHRGS
jgi:hypothetical protein